jgi:mono/diheme cytochrome c family protein
MIRFLALMMLMAQPLYADPVGDADQGAMVYAQSCARCHRDVALLDLTQVTPEDLTLFLTSHRTRSDQDRADLVAYLLPAPIMPDLTE